MDVDFYTEGHKAAQYARENGDYNDKYAWFFYQDVCSRYAVKPQLQGSFLDFMRGWKGKD